MKVIMFGATGMVGQGALRECLLDPGVETVLVVGRTPTGQHHAKLREITFWVMGGFYYATWNDILLAAPVALGGLALVCFLAWKLNILSMGDEEARSLGVNPELYRFLFIITTTLMTALTVSQVGIIAWVGLMAPHASRMIFGADNTYVVPAGALIGAIFLLLCDTLARTISGSEIPVGILTSIIGAPFLDYLLRSKGKQIYG